MAGIFPLQHGKRKPGNALNRGRAIHDAVVCHKRTQRPQRKGVAKDGPFTLKTASGWPQQEDPAFMEIHGRFESVGNDWEPMDSNLSHLGYQVVPLLGLE